MKPVYVFLPVVLLLAAAPVATAERVTYQDLLDSMVNLEQLALRPHAEEFCRQSSSYDRRTRWDAEKKTLSGTARVIEGEPFMIVVADNGMKPAGVEATGGLAKRSPHPVDGLSRLELASPDSGEVQWGLRYE